MEVNESNVGESSGSPQVPERKPGLQGWIKVGVIAAASALAGGLAAAWYYRKTLNALQEAGSEAQDSGFSVPDNETEPDT